MNDSGKPKGASTDTGAVDINGDEPVTERQAPKATPNDEPLGPAPWDRCGPTPQVPAEATKKLTKPLLPPEDVLPFGVSPPAVLDVKGNFEKWAYVAAKLIKRSDDERKQILRELKLEKIWKGAHDHWSAVLAQEVLLERDEYSEKYRKICAAEMHRRRNGTDTDAPTSGGPFIAVQPNERDAGGDADSEETQKIRAKVGPTAEKLLRPRRDFIRELAPPDIEPQTLVQGQSATAAQDMRHVADMLQTANAALDWPVEKFAKMCAELDHQAAKKALVAANYGLRGEALEVVRAGWQQRLETDAGLRSRWSDLVEFYLRELKKREDQNK